MKKKMNTATVATTTATTTETVPTGSTIAEIWEAQDFGGKNGRFVKIAQTKVNEIKAARKAKDDEEQAKREAERVALAAKEAEEKAKKDAEKAEADDKAYFAALEAEAKATSAFSLRLGALRDYEVFLGVSPDRRSAAKALRATVDALKKDPFKLAYASADDVEAMFYVEWAKLGRKGASPESWKVIKQAINDLKDIFVKYQ